jgi:predicted nuclease of predicted toxin-antitoxin system
MKIWIDAQLPPALAIWLGETFQVEALSLRDLGLQDALARTVMSLLNA